MSELLGSFFFIFFYVLSTGEKTTFSKDKVINCMIISSAYCSSRLMSGGRLVTANNYDYDKLFKNTGPLLNPAIAFG